ncbi:NAD(P)-binding protein [Butyrivibrio sp. YAB3001]|uniref:NAD(P)-binding protein n=1 Tax=Butyrivibrio sp. YAB3001 TaxID=1520812 RepID=UPI0008F65328|nr:NAD(P)-binding protein [Butyrivibrio sp. YAB3001]SFC12567.1 Phytoene dehydrogenase-related protein [Butyrivibrio sp. YAB3001]
MVYDYIVVGAGIAGMLTAAMLTKDNKKVAVLEKNKVAGGYLQDIIPGVPFGAHHIGIPNKTILQQFTGALNIPVEKHLRHADEVNVLRNEKTIRLSLELSMQKEQIKELFPEESDSAEKYFKYMTDFSDVLYSGDDRAVRKFFVELSSISFERFLRKYFKSEELIDLLSFIGPSYGGVTKEDSAFTFASLVVTYGSGAYYLETEWFIKELSRCVLESGLGDMFYDYEAMAMSYDERDRCYVLTSKNHQSVKGIKVVFASYFNDILSGYCQNEEITSNPLKKVFAMEVGPSAYRFYLKTKKQLTRQENVIMGDFPAIVSTLEEDSCNIMVTFVSDKQLTKDEYLSTAKKLASQALEENESNLELILESSPEHKRNMTANKGGAVFGWKRNNANNMTANLIYNLNSQVKDVYVVGNWGATFGFFGALYTVKKFLEKTESELDLKGMAS